jgi:hypothetical protein
VLRATKTVLTPNTSTLQQGASETFTAQVTTNQAGGPPISGAVQFGVHGSPVGSPVPLVNGQAQFVPNGLAPGSDDIDATYLGDSNYGMSEGMAVVIVNQAVSTTTITASPGTTTFEGQAGLTFTATVTGPVNTLPTGTVQFSVNGVAVSGFVSLVSGQAQFAPGLAQGILTIGATYSGDNNFAGSVGSLVETVNTAYTVTANPTTITINSPGQAGTATLTFLAMNGFSSGGTATPTLICPNLPSGAPCNITPFNLTTNGSATATLTFQTAAPSRLIPTSPDWPAISSWRILASMISLICLLPASLWLRGYIWKQRRWSWALLFPALAMLAVSAACGGGGAGGSGNGTGSGITNPGTPPGQYSIAVTMTINGVIQTMPNLTVNVQ